MNRTWKLAGIVFAIALVLRVVTLAYFLPAMNPDVDLDSYRSLARNLVAGKGFIAKSPTGKELPNVARTPVYPGFLASLIRFDGDRLPVMLGMQCLLGAIICMLAVLITTRWLSPRSAFVAGLLVALDPNSIACCCNLRTETLFTLFLLIGVWLLTWRSHYAWTWFIAGGFWSMAALTRPIAVYLWIVAIVVAWTLRTDWRNKVFFIVIFALGFFPLLGTWAYRNAKVTGQFFVSTIAPYNLLMYRAAGVEAERSGEPLDSVQKHFLAEYGDIQFFAERSEFEARLKVYQSQARSTLVASPFLAIMQAALGCGRILFGPGARSLDAMLRQTSSPASWWPSVYTGVLAIITICSLVGAWALGRNGVMLGVLALYFVLLASGPEGNSRIRVPATPLLAVLAVAGTHSLKKRK